MIKSEELSPDLQEFYDAPPKWTLKIGQNIFFSLLIVLIGILSLLHFPTIVEGKFQYTSNRAPVAIMTQVGGNVIFKEPNNAIVKAGQILAYYNSRTDINKVEKLKNKLVETISRHNFANTSWINSPEYNYLGDLTPVAWEIKRSLNALEEIEIKEQNNVELEELNNRTANLEKVRNLLLTQERDLNTKGELQKNMLQRDSGLLADKAIAASEYENEKISYLQNKVNAANIPNSIYSNSTEKIQVKARIATINKSLMVEKRLARLALTNSIHNAIAEIERWLELNTLKSRINGRLIYSIYWSDNQFIAPNVELFKVIPENFDSYYCQTIIPAANSYSIREGQRVILKFDEFPYDQNGVLKGRVSKISQVAIGGNYIVEIKLDNNISSSNTQFQLKSEMQGEVEIVTKDLRVIERLYYNLYRIFSKT